MWLSVFFYAFTDGCFSSKFAFSSCSCRVMTDITCMGLMLRPLGSIWSAGMGEMRISVCERGGEAGQIQLCRQHYANKQRMASEHLSIRTNQQVATFV